MESSLLTIEQKLLCEDPYQHIDIYYGCSQPEDVRNDLAGYIIVCSGQLASQDLTILDMGCGTGCLTIPLARFSHNTYAVDLDSRAIELTNKRKKLHKSENLTILQGNWTNLDHLVEPSTVDVVVCWGNSLGYTTSWLQSEVKSDEAIEAVRKTLLSVFKVLVVGGTFVLQIEKDENQRYTTTTREMVVTDAGQSHLLTWTIEYQPDGIRINRAQRKSPAYGKQTDNTILTYSIDFVGICISSSTLIHDMYEIGFSRVKVLSDLSNPLSLVIVGEK